MKNFLIKAVLVSAFLLLATAESQSAIEDTSSQSIKGVVEEVTSNAITISQIPSSYPEGTDKTVEVAFDNNTRFIALNSFKELKKGDTIRVELAPTRIGEMQVALEVTKVSPGQEINSFRPQTY